MKIRLRWILWGLLGATAVVAVVVTVILWGGRSPGLPSGAIFVPRDVASLDAALASVSPGGTIVIQASAGTIVGPIVLDVPDLTLASSGTRVEVTGTGGSPAVSILADGVTLRGFDIISESIGLRIDATDCLIEDIHLSSTPIGIQLNDASHCMIRSIETHGGEIGVELIDSGSVVVEESTIVGASEFGVRLLGSWNSLLKNLSLSENAVGISFEQASTDNTVEATQIEFCSIAGIEIRASNDNTIKQCTLASVRVGIVLEAVTGTEILSCELNATTVSGVLLQQSLQNRVVETRVYESEGTGIQLTQSPENALLTNDISECRDAGISVISSGQNLVMGNTIDQCSIGLAVSRSSGNRILRNSISDSSVSGFIVSQGEANRLLDNVTVNGTYGIAVVESSRNTILRNRLSGADGAGMLLSHTSGENHVAENEIRDNVRGLVLAAVTRDLFTQNQILSNDVGVWLSGLGGNVRIEGNTISENQIGLRQSANLAESESHLVALGISDLPNSQNMVPVLANNVFKDNAKLDIQNDTMIPLPVAGNWWGKSSTRDSTEAVVSDGVLLEQSAWKGVVAIGTGSTDVRILLGRILQFSLIEAGFRVVDLVGMGPSDRVRQALVDSDVDLIWWSGATLDSQAPIEATSSIVVPSSAVEGWSIIVSSRLASQLTAPTASGLSAWFSETGEQLRFASMTSFDEDTFDAFKAAYGLVDSVRSFTPAETLEEVEALLKFGAVDVAIVGNLEETLTIAGFLEIADDLAIFERSSISMIIQQSTTTDYSEISEILVALGERLTSEGLHDLVSRIRLLHQAPEDVARAFVQQ
jgi:parallel beta-helix repeat protein